MVCIYCSSATRVVNSRHQKRANNVWRRRSCQGCGALFTTEEAADLTKSLVVTRQDGTFSAFERDKLFISVYEALKHRKTAQIDATALTDSILAKVVLLSQQGSIKQSELYDITDATLSLFDRVAETYYSAYHG